MSTFVSVGNATQPFARLLVAVATNLPSLPGPVVVQHGRTEFSCVGCEAHAFVAMEDFARLIERSVLVILHAGAGSIIHAVRAGKIPVVMPRRVRYGEIVDDHQVEFAKELAGMGKVILAEEPEDLRRAVEIALLLQREARDAGQPRLVELVAKAISESA